MTALFTACGYGLQRTPFPKLIPYTVAFWPIVHYNFRKGVLCNPYPQAVKRAVMAISEVLPYFLCVSGICLFFEFIIWLELLSQGTVLLWELWLLFFPVALIITAITRRNDNNKFAVNVSSGKPEDISITKVDIIASLGGRSYIY